MSVLSESWLQDVATRFAGLNPVSAEVVQELLPIVELQIRRIIQQAHKFQRRAKSPQMKVEDVNLVLTSNNLEPLYGLHLALSSISKEKQIVDETDIIPKSTLIQLEDFVQRSIPPRPLKPSVGLHWLAVNGVQPITPQNPSIVEASHSIIPPTLPKELQSLYSRITGILMSDSSSSNNTQSMKGAVFSILANDRGLQDLVPYFSHFIYSQVKNNSKNVPLLFTIMRAVRSLHLNPTINLENQLQQLLPAIFTCVVAAKLCNSPFEDHWALREYAAALIAEISLKYSTVSPGLSARICNTYLEAISQPKSLIVVFGGIVGLGALGIAAVESVLLERIAAVEHVLEQGRLKLEDLRKASSFNADVVFEQHLAIIKCREALLVGLGRYMVSRMQLPSFSWKKPNPTSTTMVVSEKTRQGDTKKSRSRRTLAKVPPTTNFPLCELEESLVPFYVSQSRQVNSMHDLLLNEVETNAQ